MLSAEMLLADRGRDGFYAASGSAGRERLLRIPERHMICDIEPTSTGLLDLTTEIVAAYARHNALDPMDLPKKCRHTCRSRRLGRVYGAQARSWAETSGSDPKSGDGEIHNLPGGRQTLQIVKTPFGAAHRSHPDEYRSKWGVSTEYPMTALNYSATRSASARENGLAASRQHSPQNWLGRSAAVRRSARNLPEHTRIDLTAGESCRTEITGQSRLRLPDAKYSELNAMPLAER